MSERYIDTSFGRITIVSDSRMPMNSFMLKTTGTVTMTFDDLAPTMTWSGSVDSKTGIITLIGRRVDPYALDRWADDGGAQ